MLISVRPWPYVCSNNLSTYTNIVTCEAFRQSSVPNLCRAPMPVCLRPPLIAMPHYNIICTVQDSRVTSARSSLQILHPQFLTMSGFDPRLRGLSGVDEVSVFFLAKRLGGPRKPTGYYKVWVVTIMCYDVRDRRPRVNLS